MKAKFFSFWLTSSVLLAQSAAQLTIAPVARVSGKRGETVPVKISAKLADGLHCNSNAPNDPYLIPLKLTWQAEPLKAASIDYPKPKLEKSDFSEKPLSVFEGAFDITTNFSIPADAPPGMGIAGGKLRYQACNTKMCFPPKTIDVKFTYDLR